MFGVSYRLFASILLVTAVLAQEGEVPTFDTNARLVLVPFNVERARYFATDLQPADFELREDGHPRPFTTFEGPNTAHPLPLELILLFDTTVARANPKSPSLFDQDPKANYEFLNNWDEPVTAALLQKNGLDIRMAVYHYAGRQLERLCGATSDARQIFQALESLLNPIPPDKGELTLLPGRHIQKLLFGPSGMGWMPESIDSVLHDAAASPVPARRVLILFTKGASGTGGATLESTYNSIVDPALALSIPIDPVILARGRLDHIFANRAGPGGVLSTADGPPRSGNTVGPVSVTWYHNLPWVASVGEMTGGELFVPDHMDRKALAAILALARDRIASQYVVGFTPEASLKPKKHSLGVKLRSKSAGKLIGGERSGVTY